MNAEQLDELRPLAAEIEAAIAEAPIRLGSDDWGTVLAANVLARVAVYMGRTLGPDAPILAEVQAERDRQDAKWGEQNHPDGTGSVHQREAAGLARMECEDAFAAGYGTWCHVLFEEVREALAESDPAKLRAELVQVAAVATAWIAAIDRRTAKEAAS
ncbi:NUDIX hydrolase [Streptomyces sp. NPDC058291]|uniref:NUDIX hydrolase n=1 Tax=Streptomyces sp. NPDC058291 TaxID=3346427 RepID=UPI0036E8220C